MSNTVDVERAMKDPEYLMSLTKEQLASVPWNPADEQGMTEEQLDKVVGGMMAAGGECTCQKTGGSCLASVRSVRVPTAC